LYFQRLVDFDENQRSEYTRQHVAFEVRGSFEALFPALASSPKPRLSLGDVGLKEGSFEAAIYKSATVEKDAVGSENTAEQFKVRRTEWKNVLNGGATEKDYLFFCEAFAVLAAVQDLDPSSEEQQRSVRGLVSKASREQAWTVDKYNEQYARVPELRVLTTTPFMIQVRLVSYSFPV